MSTPQKPAPDDPRKQAVQSQIKGANASRETNRPSDSVPVVAGQFAHLPARFGRYEVQKLLGRGAMGAVYLARDTQLERLVALKIPKVAASGSRRLLARLEIEAKAAAQLDHPSLCKVYDAGEVDGQCFIAMQYIEGETLKSQLEARGKSVKEAVTLISQLAEGLADAHARGIIHRDLKPENIMINHRGTPVIMDFGLAKFSTMTGNAAATQAGTILGSPAYMSPEQASGNLKEIDERSDIYSLGVILFELLTGKWPFSGSAMQILGQKSLMEPISPLSLNPNLHPQLADICHKMIAKKNADRHQSLAEVIEDLGSFHFRLTTRTLPTTEVPNGEPSEVPVAIGDNVTSRQPDERIASISRRPQSTPSAGVPVAEPQSLIQRPGSWWSGRTTRMKWTMLGGAAFLFLCGVIIISIKLSDGTKATIEVPEGATVTIETGKPDDTPRRQESPPEPPPTKVAWHGWPIDAPPPAIARFNAEQANRHQIAWADYLKVSVEFSNSIGMKFVLIPPGEFMMGSMPAELAAILPAVEHQRWEDYIRSEAPQHTVILTQPIYVGVHEVTQEQFQRVMERQPSHFAATGAGKDVVAGMDTSSFPVDTVSLFDVAEFCEKLSQAEQLKPSFKKSENNKVVRLDGNGYRLPTEAEWEFACRAGTDTTYTVGAKPDDLPLVGWFGNNAKLRTHAVGELNANPFGLHDTIGNVWEWVQDNWSPTYYTQFQKTLALNPTGPTLTDSLGTMRGGNLVDAHYRCRPANRIPINQSTALNGMGFRVVLSYRAALSKTTPDPSPPPVAEPLGTKPAGSTEVVKAEPATTPKPVSPPVAMTTGWQGWPTDAPKPAIAPFTPAQAKIHQQEWATYLNVPLQKVNRIGMRFILIPPGEYLMGSKLEEVDLELNGAGKDLDWKNHIRSEAPRHKVILTEPFYLGTHEVTQSGYSSYMARQHRSHFSKQGDGQVAVKGINTSNFPAEMLSWCEAAEFCIRMSKQENLEPMYEVQPLIDSLDVPAVQALPKLKQEKIVAKAVLAGPKVTSLNGTGYRLPTEAEWEFACRAGIVDKYWTGNNDEELSNVAQFRVNSKNRTYAVGMLAPNPFGLYDIHGNVREWVEDLWMPTGYSPYQIVAALDPNTRGLVGDERGMRGGDFSSFASECRAAYRYSKEPGDRDKSTGFRVVLVLDSLTSKIAERRARLANPQAALPNAANAPAMQPKAEVSKPAAPKVVRPMTGTSVPQWEAIDQAVLAHMDNSSAHAATIAISRNGQLLVSRGYGWSDEAKLKPVAPDVLMRISGVTFAITAAAVKAATREKRLTLDTKAFDLLDLKPRTNKPVDPRLRDITVGQILTDQGGWDRSVFDPMFLTTQIEKDLGLKAPASPLNVVEFMLTEPLQFTPGSKTVNNNFGYCVLGRVLEKASGKSYSDYVQQSVLAPANIVDIKLGHSALTQRDPREVWYPASGNALSLEVLDSTAGLIASAPALCQFMQAYRINGDPRSPEKQGEEIRVGSMPGTTAIVHQRKDGFDVAILLNGQSQGNAWKEIGSLQQAIDQAINKVAAPKVVRPMTGTSVPQWKAIDQVVLTHMDHMNAQAATIAISRNGQQLVSRGYGWSDEAKSKPVAPDALMRISFVTGRITRTAVKNAVREKRLTLDTKAFEFLDLKPRLNKVADPRLRTITVGQILLRQGGWDKDVFDPMFRTKQIETELGLNGPVNPVNVVEYMLTEPLQFNPGEKFASDNFGYCVLGRVIEKATGMSYAAYIQQSVLKPAGIRDIKPGHSALRLRDPREVWYPVAEDALSMEVLDSTAGLIASAPALCQFMQAYNLNGDPRSLEPREDDMSYGTMPGTTSISLQRKDGFNVAVLLNGRRSRETGLADIASLRQAIDQTLNQLDTSK